jgi:hypothetical protein
MPDITPETRALIDERNAIPRGSNPQRCVSIFNQLEKQFGYDGTCQLLAAWPPEPKTPKVKTAKKTFAKKEGAFKTRRLRNYPDYWIDENGQVTGPSGTALKFRWNFEKPYVRISGKDRSVFYLLTEAQFQESQADKRERRKKATEAVNLYGGYNDADEAAAEDPESFGLDEDGNEVE